MKLRNTPLLATLALAGPALATTWDAATQFSTVQNPPAGTPWSYGRLSAAGADFALDSTPVSGGGLAGWAAPATYPDIEANVSGGPLSLLGDGLVPTGRVTVSAGPSGTYGVIRFTAPTTGGYLIDTYFTGVYDNANGTDAAARVFLSATPLFSSDLLKRTPASFRQPLYLPAGATLDFAINWGPDAEFGWDRVVVDATLSTLLPGDANLNGVIDPDDFTLTDRGFSQHLTGWSDGDFNGDNLVNAADYALLHQSLSTQNGGHFMPAALTVPEPSSLSSILCFLSSFSLLKRERCPR